MIQYQLRKMSALKAKLTNNSLQEKCEIIRSENILEQFQTHKAKSDEDDNDCDDDAVNHVATEQPSGLTLESALDALENSVLCRIFF